MTARFPIYAKVLVWFFLNLLVVAGVGAYLLKEHIGAGKEWLLTRDARTRINAMTEAVMGELRTSGETRRPGVLKRFGDAYQMEFSLWQNDGGQLIGEALELPDEVMQAIHRGDERPPRGEPPPPPPSPGPEGFLNELFDGGPGGPPPEPPGDQPGGGFGRGQAKGEGFRGDRNLPNPIQLVTSTDPEADWLLVRVPWHLRRGSPPVRATLVGRFSSLADGGLLIDLRPWIWAGVGLLVFSMIFWLPLIRSMTKAISQMTRATEQIAEGQFDVQVDEKRWDEIGRLGVAVNRMANRLSGFVTGQKRFLGDIAHELCSPLARMEMALGVMRLKADDSMAERVDDVNEDVREMSDLVNELLSFSKAGLRAPDAPLQAVKLHDVAASMIEREHGSAEVVNEVPEDMEVMAVESLLARALANLVRNAVRYAAGGGAIEVGAAQVGSEVLIRVSDRGPGVPEAALSQLFEAFYRPDAARSRETGGAGLGLAIVKTCVESMRGKVSARNRDGGGLEVVITLDAPAHQKARRPTLSLSRQAIKS